MSSEAKPITRNLAGRDFPSQLEVSEFKVESPDFYELRSFKFTAIEVAVE